MTIERITLTNAVGAMRYGHECRYRLAAGFVRGGYTVLDAACGTGYGADLLPACRYVGVDRENELELPLPTQAEFVQADLETWKSDIDFDVALSFETLEHLDDYTQLVTTLKQAHRWLLVSVPIVPTVGANPFHRHNFVSGDLEDLFADDEWETYQVLGQPSELAQIAIFRRR